MGDWTDIRFEIKPTLIDASFLEKLDACFAAIGHRPTPAGIVGRPVGDIEPSRRLEAMDEAEYDTFVFDPEGERWTTACLGYSASGTPDDTSVHLWLVVWETERYVDSLRLTSHVDGLFFRPDYVDEGDEGEGVREWIRTSLLRVNVVRRVVPLIHEAFGAYYTASYNDADGPPSIVLGNSRPHPLTDFRTESEAIYTLYEMTGNKWVCPVCGAASLLEPPWHASRPPEPPGLRASFETCPICRTRFGVDDTGTFRSIMENRPDTWDKLQRKWLKRKL